MRSTLLLPLVGSATEYLPVEPLPVRGDAPLRGPQADPARANPRAQPGIERVLGEVARRVVREGVLLREQVGNVVGAAQSEGNNVIDLQRVPEVSGRESVFSLDFVLSGPPKRADRA